MFSDPALDGEKITELSKEIQMIESELEAKEERWMELSDWA